MSLFHKCVFACVWVCVCLSGSVSTLMHQRHLIYQCTTAMVSFCSPYKQTCPCLQMKTNIDEIKLEKEYLISELNIWIKLGCLYWIKPVGIGSTSSKWENRGVKNIFLFLCIACLCIVHLFPAFEVIWGLISLLVLIVSVNCKW